MLSHFGRQSFGVRHSHAVWCVQQSVVMTDAVTTGAVTTGAVTSSAASAATEAEFRREVSIRLHQLCGMVMWVVGMGTEAKRLADMRAMLEQHKRVTRCQLDALVGQLRGEQEQLRGQLASLQASLREAKRCRRERVKELEGRLDAALKERDDALKERDDAMKERDAALKERDDAMKERDDAWAALAAKGLPPPLGQKAGQQAALGCTD